MTGFILYCLQSFEYSNSVLRKLVMAELTSQSISTTIIGPKIRTLFLTEMFVSFYFNQLMEAMCEFTFISIITKSYSGKLFAHLSFIFFLIDRLRDGKIKLIISFFTAITFSRRYGA